MTMLRALRSFPEFLAAQEGGSWDRDIEAAARAVMGGAMQGFASEMRGLDEGESLVSILPISDSGWYLANVVRSSRLYERGAGIWRAVLVIGLVAIGLGAALAMLLISGIYNPLERLLGRFRALFGIPLPDEPYRTDEYRVIDEALTGISTRMDELQATIVANRPVIGHELLLRLLEGSSARPSSCSARENSPEGSERSWPRCRRSSALPAGARRSGGRS
jgi:hypothetical protein